MDSEGTRRAFEELRPLLEEQNKLRRIVLDAGKVAALVAAMGRMVQQADIRARFAALPLQAFDIRHVDNLERAGLAMWYAFVQQMRASVGASRSAIPADVVAEATEVKQRMLMVAQYHLGGDEDVAAELADIRGGQGHADLSADLLRLAQIYEAHEGRISQDPSHYRPGDRGRAGELAQRILEYLGEGAVTEERRWADYVQRAWTFAVNTYEEVSATGRWLFRHEEGEEKFPSLFATLRQSSGSRATTPADSAPDADGAGLAAHVAAEPMTAADSALALQV